MKISTLLQYTWASFTVALCLPRPNEGLSTAPKPIPITVLGGFLGAGKTTLLQNMLENNEGLKIAIVVNDVAAVNIDSKLVSTTNKAAGMVELQNGCACCSKSDELLASVSELVALSDLRGESDAFDHIVVEMSGVADPLSVRSKFQEAELYDMPLMKRVKLDTMVTLVDCSAYMEYLKSPKIASTEEAPELYYPEGVEPPNPEELLSDLPQGLREALLAGAQKYSADDESYGAVASLLVSQTEIADLVLLNKIDLVADETVTEVQSIVQALNPRATIRRSKYGGIALKDVLGVAKGQGIVQAGMLDDHRDAIAATSSVVCADPGCTDPSHSHSHTHDHNCMDADCTDSSHSHDHTHEVSTASAQAHAAHSHEHDHECNDPDCADHSHNHDHACVDPTCTDTSHSHSHDHACADPACTDSSHSHSHDHSCEDPACTDSSHSHSHDHSCDDPACTDPSHSKKAETSHPGIDSFVYRARRPFHPGRLVSFLRHLPVKRGLPVDVSADMPLDLPDIAKTALGRVIRSKGFAWCADSNVKAMYWSQAGSSFEMGCLGSWWATLPRDQWPEEAVSAILEDFDDKEHDEFDPNSSSVGDRRQEVVFIGPTLGTPSYQDAIRDALSKCLLDDDELLQFSTNKSNENGLSARFASPFEAKVLTY